MQLTSLQRNIFDHQVSLIKHDNSYSLHHRPENKIVYNLPVIPKQKCRSCDTKFTKSAHNQLFHDFPLMFSFTLKMIKINSGLF